MSSMGVSANLGDRARFLPLTRVLFVVAVVGAIGLGYVGIARYIAAPPAKDLNSGFWNVAYYDLQLFVLGSDPLQRPGPYPWPLNVARFAAPAATVYALFEAGRVLFQNQYQLWRRRHRRRHVIVTGDSTAASAFVARLRESDRRVTQAMGGDRETLAAAGIAGADVLYACLDDPSDAMASLATVMAATTAQRHRNATKLKVYAQVGDAELALALRARRLGLPEANDVHVDFFNVEELAARHLLAPADVQIDADRAPRIVVLGLGTFGRMIVVEYARYWRRQSPRRGERVAVTMVGPRARQVAKDLTDRWDIVADVCDLTGVDPDAGETVDHGAGEPPHRVFVCHEDEDLALRTALTAVDLWRGGQDSVVVRLDRLDRHSEAFHTPSHAVLDTIGDRLRLVSLAKLASDQNLEQEDLVEWLAASIHWQYLPEQLRDATSAGGPAQAVAMVPWSELSEDLREANRDQAADIGRKLATVGCAVAPKTGPGGFTFTDAEVEALAQLEHKRWLRERRSRGWGYGDERDDIARRHPCIVGWEALAESERDKDRDAIRAITTVLADVGLRVVRLQSPHPAPASATASSP